MADAVAIFQKSLENLWREFLTRLPGLLIGLLVLVVFVFCARLMGQAVRRTGDRTRLHGNLALLLSRLASTTLVVLGVLVAAVVAFPAFRPGDLVAGLGITSVAVGFAFKDILQNFFAGILILWRQPFQVGDEIRSGDFEGVVEDINTRSTRIRTYDGERAVLPNGDVYTRAILVRTAYSHRRVRFTVGIGYKDSIEDARSVVHRVLASAEGVLPEPGPAVYVSELAASSVNLTVLFWVEPQQANLLRVRDRVATGIKNALDEAGIDMPYPHQVVLLRQTDDVR